MSKALATKNVAAVLLSVAMVFGVTFAFASPAKAQTLESLQAQIQALLAQIAALQGGSSTTPGASCTTFTRNHQMGDTGGEVMAVQKFLNSHGAVISASGAGSPGNETSFFGGLTKAAVAKFQAANGISPAAGYWGPMTRAKANSMCSGTPGTTPGVPVTGNGLKVMLASDSPVNVALVQGQAVGELAKFTFANPTGSTVSITNVSLARIGVSNDSTLTNVYLYDGAARLTDSAGVSNSAISFNDPSGIFTLAPGQVRTISVRADIAGSTSGQQVGVQLKSVAASGALDSTVVFPITGGIQTVSAATLATVDFGSTTLPSSSTVAPQNDYVVWQNTVTVGTRAVRLDSFQLRNIGSVDNDAIRNLRLYVDGVQVGGSINQLMSGEASVYWDLTATPKRLETGGRVIKVVADIVGGSGDTFQLSLRRAGDARVVDTDLNQPVLATAAGSTFSARSATQATIDSGSTSVVKAATSPSSNVTLGASNILFARFELRAAGEQVKVESLDVQANTSLDHGLDNGKVFFDGVQVGSTKDLTDATDVNFTFGSSMILKPGQTHIVEIYADAKTTTGAAFTSGDTATITLGQGNANGQGQTSLSTSNVPTADVPANQITISSSSLTGSKASGYGNQTLVAGTNNAKIGSFTLTTGATEGANINTIVINLTSNMSSTVSDLRLVDNSTGVQIGTTKATPSTSNSFSVNFTIPASGSKTIDVVGNLKSGAVAGSDAAVLDDTTGGTGVTTGNSVTVGSDINLQTITVSTSGSLTAAVGVSPDDTIVVAGTSNVKIGSFNFTAVNAAQTVQEIKVKVPNNAATAVSSVILKYKDAAGTDQTASAALAASSTLPYATATYTGLTFYIPANTSRTLDVYVDTVTVASGARSGAQISALLDGDEGFKAVDSAGNSDVTLTGSTSDLNSTNTSGKGNMLVRKTVPTLSSVALDTATLSNGTDKVIGRVKVTADAAGDVDWGQIVFTVNKTSYITLGATTTIKLYEGSSSSSIGGSFATTTGSIVGGLEMFTSGSTGATSGQIHFRTTASTTRTVAAGTSATYELRTTVGGISTSGGYFLDVSIANPSSSVTTSDFSNVAGAAGAFGNLSNPSFVWSDWSDLSDHASAAAGVSTLDWTNDYLVKALPLTIGNKTVSI